MKFEESLADPSVIKSTTTLWLCFLFSGQSKRPLGLSWVMGLQIVHYFSLAYLGFNKLCTT